jgi:hypothetical protein
MPGRAQESVKQRASFVQDLFRFSWGGDPLYHPAGAPGPSGGTSSDPSSLRPRLSSSDSMPAAGMLTETGSEAGKASCDAEVRRADGTAVSVAAATLTGDVVSAGDAGVAVAAAGIAAGCAEVLVAQPVRSSKATAADANWHLRRALVELVIRRLFPIRQCYARTDARRRTIIEPASAATARPPMARNSVPLFTG